MKRKDFLNILNSKGVSYKLSEKSIAITGDSVYLSSLTSLPEGTKFENGGYVDLPSLKGSYSLIDDVIKISPTPNIKIIDGFAMVVFSKRRIKGDIIIYNTEYLGSGEKSYVAEINKYYAHGETAKEAVEDVRFKLMSETLSKDEIINRIKDSKKVTVNDYRLITGACREGCKNFLESKGLNGTTEMPLKDALFLVQDAYGGDYFIKILTK